MSDLPWLTIVGLGEDGPDGLCAASRTALQNAQIIMGPPRHLGLLPQMDAELIEWPVPFAGGIDQLLELRGKQVVVLASGDPFWFGAGSVITAQLAPNEWRAFAGISAFSLAASRLGWPLEKTTCLGLHAASLDRLRPHLADGQRAIVLLRDGSAVQTLSTYLTEAGFGASMLHVAEALGGPRERLRSVPADAYCLDDVSHPVCVGINMAGSVTLPLTTGRPDAWFDHDGQITKQPVRALTLSALAPVPGERLWDIGGGSGSIAIEWLLAHPSLSATCFETSPERARNIQRNAVRLGVDRLNVIQGKAPACLADQPTPDAVFIGGGLSDELLNTLWDRLPTGTRLVANAVTLESEAILANWQAKKGGELMRIELSRAKTLGSRRGWNAAYPIVQWSVTL